jgi:hypothetical protein
MPRYRHIVGIANRQLQPRYGVPNRGVFRPRMNTRLADGTSNRSAISRLKKHANSGKGFPPAAIAALHQVNYATIYNYLVMELRYMDAGEEAQKRWS